MKAGTAVFYNDGSSGPGKTGPGVFRLALVVADDGGSTLDLTYWNGSTWQGVLSIPQRELTDYDEAGGGVTWHSV